MLSIAWWRDRLYPDRDRQNTFKRFMIHLNKLVTPDARILDIGAGAGERNVYDFKSRCREIIGIDVDPRVETNPLLDRGVCTDGRSLPFEDSSFDVIFSIYVLEHVNDPDSFTREVVRVLKPGGVFISLTPNTYHYVSFFATITPDSFHKWFNRHRGRDEEDTFPTCYKLNTLGSQRKWFGAHGCQLASFERLEIEPQYLKFSLPTYLIGALYERIVNTTRLLGWLRVNIIAAWRKPSDYPARQA